MAREAIKMINAKKYENLTIIEDGVQKELTDVMIVPVWLLRSILRYEDESMMLGNRGSLTDYGKGIYDTLQEQRDTLSINTKRDYEK